MSRDFTLRGRNSSLRFGSRAVAVGVLALLVASCSADWAMFRADWNWWSNTGSQAPQAAPPDGLVSVEGSCPPAANPPRGIALGMTECDLIRAAGATDQITVSMNERGERIAVITYPQGEHAGIYRFGSGLLVSIERAPEPAGARRAQPQPRRADGR